MTGESSPGELQDQRDFLLRSIEDLEAERAAGDLAEADYEALRSSYTARAASVLRAIDDAGTANHSASPTATARAGAMRPAAPAGATDPAGETDPTGPAGVPVVAGPRSRTRRPSARPFLTLAAVLALAGLAGALMARSAGERLPGEAASGSLTATGASSDLQRARALIGEGRTLEAIKTFDKVLKEDPRQPEALAYRGWLLRLAGRAGGDRDLVDSGLSFIERAVAADPGYPDAHFFRGIILYQDRGDAAGAVTEFRAFLANDPPPEMVPVVEDSLRRALSDTQAAPPSPAPGPSSQRRPQPVR
ncbi:MAG TPA: tetratricopeptide repeat protein [Acidimicrobiales bacterium]|nr:tetratricopeptide repeat protein [Acidimicrobiales bacterium]